MKTRGGEVMVKKAWILLSEGGMRWHDVIHFDRRGFAEDVQCEEVIILPAAEYEAQREVMREARGIIESAKTELGTELGEVAKQSAPSFGSLYSLITECTDILAKLNEQIGGG